MAARLRTGLLLVVALALPLGSARAQNRPVTLVYSQASVRAMVPSLGTGWYYGIFTFANTPQGKCLGVALKIAKLSPNPIMVTLTGVSRLQVDWRTNIEILTLGLEPASDSDWKEVDLKAVARGDTECRK